MNEKKGNLYRYLLWGCGTLLAVPILAVSAIAIRTWLPLRSADVAAAHLEDRFGAPGGFHPDPHGEIDAGRMEAFLNVRRSLMEICPRFEALEEWRRRFDAEMSEEEPPTGREVIDVTKGFVGALDDLTPVVGELFSRRNKVLVESEMGVGEYIYLFTVAYREALAGENVSEMLFADGVSIAPESAAALRAMLGHQLERLVLDGLPQEIAALEAEIVALQLDRERVPWQDGLPVQLAESVAPYRTELDRQFCPQTAGMEIDLDAGRAMAIALD